MTNSSFHGIPNEIEHLIHLRRLDLTANIFSKEDIKTICKLYNLRFLRLTNCLLEEVPREIDSLINLRYLDLSHNIHLTKLPESICSLHELRTLDIANCINIYQFPEGINRLINLEHLFNLYSILQFPQGLAQLTNLRSLSSFVGGNFRRKLRLLKNLRNLSGFLSLIIRLSVDPEDMVEDAREADLRNEMHLRELKIKFEDEMNEKNDWVWMNVLDALEPHPNLQHLEIYYYAGFKLEGRITSPFFQLRFIHLSYFTRMPSLPPLGKLPCLEEISIREMIELRFVGWEFVGITGDIGFPMLKKLTFERCPNWVEWEDLTVGEEDSASVTSMPCLEELVFHDCHRLTVLPHRLLGKKALSLEYVENYNSSKLVQHYKNREGGTWDRRVLKVRLRPK